MALALALGASRVEIAHVQYYGWALKNRAALMPTREQVEQAVQPSKVAQRASRRHRHRRRRARLLRALPKPCVGRLGPALAQRHAGGQGAAVPRGRESFPGLNSGPCATIRWPTSGRMRRHLMPFAAPTGCRSRAAAARGASIDFGGCRCQAFAITGDARATDPVCHLAPEPRQSRRACCGAEHRALRLSSGCNCAFAWSWQRFKLLEIHLNGNHERPSLNAPVC